MALGTIDTNQIASEAVTVPKVTDQVLSNRNLIINGAMTVHQRGNQVTAGSTSVYFLDRWNIYHNTAAAANLQQSTVVPAGQGFGNSMLIDCTTADTSVAAGDVAVLRQIIEGQNLQQLAYGTSSAKSITLSFWVRSTKTGAYNCEIYHNDSQARTQSHQYTISQADTWEKKEITFSGDTSASIDNDNQATFYVQWSLIAGTDYTSGSQATTWTNLDNTKRFTGQVNFFDNTNNNFYLTGVQLEVGVQTPFEHEDIGTTLSKCQRYYNDTRSGGSSYGGVVMTHSVYATYAYGTSVFPTEMRAKPTVVFYDGPGTAGTITENGAANNRGVVANSTSKYAIVGMQSNNTGSGNFSQSAGSGYHLFGTYTASAEL